MPNHVRHRITVTGPAAESTRFWEHAFKRAASENGVQEATLTFDFNAFIPMPKELEETTSDSLGSLGRLAWYGVSDNPFSTLERVLDYPWVKDAGVTDAEGLRAL